MLERFEPVTADIALNSVHIPVRRRPAVIPRRFDDTFPHRVLKDIEDAVPPGLWVEDVGIVAAPPFPQGGRYPLSVLCRFGWSLLDRFKYVGHVVDLVHWVDEHVNVIGHEDISEDGEVVVFRCFGDAFGQGFTDSIVEQVLAAMMG